MKIGGIEYDDLPISGAVFTDIDRRFRLALWRIWERAKPPLLFIGLNPSRASEYRDDPTIVRVVRFAKENGFGALFVGNLFDQVTPYPSALDIGRDQAANDETLRQMRDLCSEILVGWGALADIFPYRAAEVLKLVGKPVLCLGKTKDGWPRHPLFIPADTPFEEYKGGAP